MSAGIIFIALLFVVLMYFVFFRKSTFKKLDPETKFPIAWRKILVQKVAFYNALSAEERKQFEFRIQEFLLNHKVTGVKIEVDITDRLLVASSAIVPVFAFANWHYSNFFEVLIYQIVLTNTLRLRAKSAAYWVWLVMATWMEK